MCISTFTSTFLTAVWSVWDRTHLATIFESWYIYMFPLVSLVTARYACDYGNACTSSEPGAPLSQRRSLYGFFPLFGFNRVLPKGKKPGQSFPGCTMAANILKKNPFGRVWDTCCPLQCPWREVQRSEFVPEVGGSWNLSKRTETRAALTHDHISLWWCRCQ